MSEMWFCQYWSFSEFLSELRGTSFLNSTTTSSAGAPAFPATQPGKPESLTSRHEIGVSQVRCTEHIPI